MTFRYRYILNFLPLFLIINTQIKYALRKEQLLFDFNIQLSKNKGLSGLVFFLKEVWNFLLGGQTC